MANPDISLQQYHFTRDMRARFDVHRHPLTPRPIFDMHLAPEIGVVLSGRMARHNAGAYSELPRGGLWIAGSLEPHGRQALEPGSLVAVFIVSIDFFNEVNVPGVDNRFWQAPFNVPPGRRPVLIDEKFASLIEGLTAFLDTGPAAAARSAAVHLALLETLSLANHLGSFKTEGQAGFGDFRRLRPAMDLVCASPHPIDTAEAARLCQLSISQFTRLFQRAAGLSFSKFSLRYRLSQIARELKSGDLALDELAAKWGFTDKSHLVHRFKEHYSVTPTRFRKT